VARMQVQRATTSLPERYSSVERSRWVRAVAGVFVLCGLWGQEGLPLQQLAGPATTPC
jgi:hypothetical protein